MICVQLLGLSESLASSHSAVVRLIYHRKVRAIGSALIKFLDSIPASMYCYYRNKLHPVSTECAKARRH